MQIRILVFAGLREIVGAGEIELEIPQGASLGELMRRLEQRYPPLEGYRDRLAVAVDGQLAELETALVPDAEVALLPPVSGGLSPTRSAPVVELVETPIDSAAVADRVARPGFGAVVVFHGTVRDGHRGRPVERLRYEAYRPMARAALERIVEELEERHAPAAVAVVHRLGDVPVGEASVVIATASPHRDAAYAASREALERLKREVPIWKQERYVDGGSDWREEEPLTASRAAADPTSA